MNSSLRRKRYRVLYIIPFIFLSSLFSEYVCASPEIPPGRPAPTRIDNRLYFTPACPIIAQNFNNAADVNGATSDPTSTGWYLDASKVPNAAYFSIKSHRLKAQTLGGEGVWYSQVFSIAGYTGVQIDAKVSTEGTKTNAEYVKIFHKLNGGPEILDTALYGNFGTPMITSPQMTGNTVQIVIRIYDTTSGNSEYYIEQYDVFKEVGPCSVTGITVTASATNSGVLTCASPSTTLTAGTTATGTTTYSWTGPNNFTSTSANPVVSTAGTYTVTGTNSAGTGTASVTVTSNTTVPAGVAASNNGPLTCTTTSVTLTGSSTTTSGVTFAWVGPNSFTATGATAAVSAPGTYTVTATNTTTGCTATATTTVAQNITAPAGVTATNNGPLTCATSSVNLTGSSTTTSGTSFSWTGPNNFTGSGTVATAFAPGVYTLTVTNTANGCTSTAATTVAQNLTTPDNVTITPSAATLTCSNPSVTLTGSSSTAGSSYSWSGPNSFTASGTTATVSAQGVYILTVTNPATGCTRTTAATITQNFTPPTAVTAINNGPLTCSTTSVSLTGSSSTSGVNYNWTGPNSFIASTAIAATSTAGTYTLQVTDPQNGCSAIASTTVAQNLTAPAGLTISSSSSSTNPVLTCATTSITLTASSTTTGVSFNWSGPNSATSSSATITVSSPGTYIVTATNPTTGCTSTASTIVTQDTARPAALTTTAVPVSAQLTCTNSSVTFTAGSSTPGLSFTWSGPGGALPSSSAVTVSAVGTYTLTAVNPVNGCTASASSTVTQNIAVPGGVTTTADPTTAQITCIHPTVLLTSSSTTPGVTYSWSGPSGFSAPGASATASIAGTYTVTVTDPANGCVTVLPGTVTKNVSVPVGLSASPSDIISCFTPVIDLQGSSTTPGATFSWAGPGGYTASTATAETDMPGSYTLTVTNPANGCTASTGTSVTADTVTPKGVTASNNGPLNCINTSVTLTGGFSTATGDYLWVTPGNTFISGASTVVTTPGVYTFVVTDDDNGCASQATTTVVQNTTGCSGGTALAPGSASSVGRQLQDATTDPVTGFSYKAYPNPFTTTAFIEFTAPVSSLVTVDICNSYGYREKLLFSKTVIAGQVYRLELGAGGLPSGAHFCVIRSNGKTYTSKLILIK